MRSIVLFFCFSVLCLNVYTQQIYFGYPDSTDNLKKGDKIILNIPIHKDGRFIPEKGIDRLIQFLNSDSNFVFRIEIHFFYGSDDFVEKYSRFLCKNLKTHLLSECRFSNYDIYNCGNTYPFFFNEESAIYDEVNTRMELIVK